MYHSITIGGKNTWDDWHLIPVSRPLVNPPTAKVMFVDIPGMDGGLDLTTSITGKTMYGDRTGSWSFFVENDFKPWSNLYSEIMAYLHGKRYKAILEDDPGFYYEGRFSVNEWRSDASRSMITISYELSPYKMYESGASGKWLWDDLKFGTYPSTDEEPQPDNKRGDKIEHYQNLVVKPGKSLIVDVTGDAMDVVPNISCSANNIMMTFGGHSYFLKYGNNFFEDVTIVSGNNRFVFANPGTVKAEISLYITGGRL